MSKEQAERLNEKGKQLGRAKKHMEALEYFISASEICPEEGKYRYNMGIAYKNTKRNEEALRSFFDALELGYEHNDCYCAIGVILRDKAEYELAESYFNKALQQDPECMGAIVERATNNFFSGQKEKALDDVNFLISRNPEDSKYYLLRAILYHSFGMKDELSSELDKARKVYEAMEKKMKLSRKQKPKTFETAH